MIDNTINYVFGSCSYSFEYDYVHIYNLFIHKRYRNKGKARLILYEAIEKIRKLDYFDEISIVANPKEVSINKTRLKAFYSSMGLKVYDYYG